VRRHWLYRVTFAFTLTERADQLHHDNSSAHSTALVQALFGKASHHPGLSATLRPIFGSLRLLTFPKAQIAFKREEIRECDRHTVHKLSQRCLTADWLAPRESDCSRMNSKVSSDWLHSYIKAKWLVLEILKMVWYVQGSPRKNCISLQTLIWPFDFQWLSLVACYIFRINSENVDFINVVWVQESSITLPLIFRLAKKEILSWWKTRSVLQSLVYA